FLSSSVGIVLRNTGLLAGHGGLTVTGDGTGLPENGGRIRRKTGVDGDLASGVGIYLESTKAPSFNWMHLTGLQNSGIVGRNVHGFTLANTRIDNIGDMAGINEGPVIFGLPGTANGLVGTAHISNTTIELGVEHNVAFYNQSGIADIQFDGVLVAGEAACVILGASGTGLVVQMEGTATGSLSMDTCRMRDNAGVGVRATAADSASLTVDIRHSEFVRIAQGLEGLVLGNAGNAALRTTLIDNLFHDFPN